MAYSLALSEIAILMEKCAEKGTAIRAVLRAETACFRRLYAPFRRVKRAKQGLQTARFATGSGPVAETGVSTCRNETKKGACRPLAFSKWKENEMLNQISLIVNKPYHVWRGKRVAWHGAHRPSRRSMAQNRHIHPTASRAKGAPTSAGQQ